MTRIKRISSIWRPGEDSRRDPVTVETVSALEELPETPEVSIMFLVLPGEQLLDFGDFLPASGTLLLRVRAWQSSTDSPSHPDLRINFGYQPSNNSKTSFRVGEWTITSIQTARSSTKWTSTSAKFRATPFVVNIRWASATFRICFKTRLCIHIDYIGAPHYEVAAGVTSASVCCGSGSGIQPSILSDFIRRAWRRPATELELGLVQRDPPVLRRRSASDAQCSLP